MIKIKTTKKTNERATIISGDKMDLEFDPDKLNLTKKDLVSFCDKMITEWKLNKRSNFRYILAMEIMKAQIKITPENVLKMIWGKIIEWFYDLNFENALHDPTDEGLKFFKKLRSGERIIYDPNEDKKND